MLNYLTDKLADLAVAILAALIVRQLTERGKRNFKGCGKHFKK